MNKKNGFTLVEMLVVIGIFSLIMTAASYFAYASFRYYNFVLNQAAITQALQKSINIMSKEIREMIQADSGAFALESADDNDIIFYADIDDDDNVERVNYYREGDCLNKATIEPSGVPPRYLEIDTEIEEINCNLDNSAEESLFTYYDGFPDETSELTTPVGVEQVRVIGIFLKFSVEGKQPLPTSKTVSLWVTPRNINQE